MSLRLSPCPPMESGSLAATLVMRISLSWSRSCFLTSLQPLRSKPGWLKLQFPLMYQTDALEVVDLLHEAGCSDGRMDEAIAVIASKQDAKGRWMLESTLTASSG